LIRIPARAGELKYGRGRQLPGIDPAIVVRAALSQLMEAEVLHTQIDGLAKFARVTIDG
jgi:hypothetical protein